MCTSSEFRQYRLVQWRLAKRISNEILDYDPEYTFDSISDREYRYECSIISCRSMHDLRMTPSGIFCEAHYLPWLHLDSNGSREFNRVCRVRGCLEPPVSTLPSEDRELYELNTKKLCRNHQMSALGEDFVSIMTEAMLRIQSHNPTLLGTSSDHFGRLRHSCPSIY